MDSKFLNCFRTALELDENLELSGEEFLANFQTWDSMAVISVIAFADVDYGKTISGEQIIKCKTVSDLAKLIEDATGEGSV